MTSFNTGHREKRGICLSTLSVCAGCGKAPQSRSNKPKRCSRCKAESYCNATCQRLAWDDGHRGLCKSLCKIAVSDRSLPEVLENRQTSQASREAIDFAVSSASAVQSSGESNDLFAKAMDLLAGKVGVLDGPLRQERLEKLPDGPSDADEAHSLLRRAADLGHKGAQYNVALGYAEGGYFSNKERGGEADEANLLKWIKLAAENGHAEAQTTYGCKYWYEGRDGHAVNILESATWVRRAIAHGVSETEGPDPRGDALSRRSFEAGVKDAIEMGRKLYLEKFPSYLDSDGDEDVMESMRLAADCGHFPSIQSCSHS